MTPPFLRLAGIFSVWPVYSFFIWFVSLKALYLWHSYAKISFFLPQGFQDFSAN